jgi:hypothetical protein
MSFVFTTVHSSAFHSFLYLPKRKALLIYYRKGEDCYAYYGVEQTVVTALERAPSKGTFLHERIKNSFQWCRLGEVELNEEYRCERALQGITAHTQSKRCSAFRTFLDKNPAIAARMW